LTAAEKRKRLPRIDGLIEQLERWGTPQEFIFSPKVQQICGCPIPPDFL
jgi:hypothetical protein